MSTLRAGDTVLEARSISKEYIVDASAPRLFIERLTGIAQKRQSFHALKPMDLEIKVGSTIGILGRNGAGKSTLLSLLSGISPCTSGTISRYGRVAALIGVGQSFNDDLSGRQNAQRFCRLQGVSGKKVAEIIEQIAEFAELGLYFDRAVKTYSSGMKARLNFSCATSIEADLIIIDEVLAVGDAEFRSKCYSRIESSINRGQTYIMVSHSANVIGNYCDRALLIEKGELIFAGDPLGAMQEYASITKVQQNKKRSAQELMLLRESDLNGRASMESACIQKITLTGAGTDGEDRSLEKGDKVQWQASEKLLTVQFQVSVKKMIKQPRVACGWRSSSGIMVSVGSQHFDNSWHAGTTQTIEFSFVPRLTVGSYGLRFTIAETCDDVKDILFERESVFMLDIVKGFRGGLVDLGIEITQVDDEEDAETVNQFEAEIM